MASALKKHVVRVHQDIGTVRRAINNNNRVGPEEDDDAIKRKLSTSSSKLRSLERPHNTTTTPTTPTTPARRPRSASESDLSMPYVTHWEELEGMNAMLDFIERLLHHQETHALSNFNRLLYHHHYHDNQSNEEEEEDSELNIGGRDVMDVEGDFDNAAFLDDTEDLTMLAGLTGPETGKEVVEVQAKQGDMTPKNSSCKSRRKSNAEELLYLMLMKSGKPNSTTTTTTTDTTTAPLPNDVLHYPAPNSTSSHHNLTLLTQFFRRHVRRQHSPLNSTTLATQPQIPLPCGSFPRPPPPPREGDKELTKL